MSKNIVNIMLQLSYSDGLVKLLVNNVDNPFSSSLPVINNSQLINPDSIDARIFPYPFDPEAQIEDSSFIRVYYNNGEFDGEIIAESQLHIDIIVAKSLWLINNEGRSLIRPYEIMGLVTDLLGTRSNNDTLKLKFTGWQHLAVNTKFDAIRLYSEYMSVEA
jgi:hypothetical protein